jgi:hypothetical protein
MYLLMPFTGLCILAALYISGFRTGYFPGLNTVLISLVIIALLSIIMIFVIGIYKIRFEYDHFEWRDFLRKKEMPYSPVNAIYAFSGTKGKREYSYIELHCSTREKPVKIDTRYYDKYGRSEIIRLLCMRSPEAKLNSLAISIRENRKDTYRLSKLQIISISLAIILCLAIEIYVKFYMKL